MIKKFVSLNLGAIIALMVFFYIVYHCLLQDNALHISIASIMAHSHHLAITKHLIVVGLLPIYIAVMIFGAAMLGTYLGRECQHFLTGRTKRNSNG